MEVTKRFILATWVVCWGLVMLTQLGKAERVLRLKTSSTLDGEGEGSVVEKEKEMIWGDGFMVRVFYLFLQAGKSTYHHVWPEMEFGWKLVVGSIIGFFGAALGSIGGVGGGGIFVPMLTLIIGFDPKSSTAISKCMIMGAAASTVSCNLRLRHPTLDLPIIDYDLALLVQPMLMLGISIGVAFNIIFAEWMVTVLLIILFIGTSTKTLFKGIETWKKETIMKKEAAKLLKSEYKPTDIRVQEYKLLPSDLATSHVDKVSVMDNVYWKDFMLLAFVWVAFLAIQIVKTYVVKCSVGYWILNALQVPISVSVSIYEAISLYRGKRAIASVGKEIDNWKVHQLFLYCFFGIIAGIVGGLLGLGGGFIMGPLFLELGVPPQVASATSTFAMVFSSTMSVIHYYILKRFPIPYAVYFGLVATVAAFTGQHIVRKLIMLLGRASLIIFVLALTIFMSAISLGGVEIADLVEKLNNHEHMGFQSLCVPIRRQFPWNFYDTGDGYSCVYGVPATH